MCVGRVKLLPSRERSEWRFGRSLALLNAMSDHRIIEKPHFGRRWRQKRRLLSSERADSWWERLAIDVKTTHKLSSEIMSPRRNSNGSQDSAKNNESQSLDSHMQSPNNPPPRV